MKACWSRLLQDSHFPVNIPKFLRTAFNTEHLQGPLLSSPKKIWYKFLCLFLFLCFKFGLIIWISSNWLKFRRVVHCYMLITVLMFVFSKFFSFIFFGQIWSQNLKFFKLTEIWYRGRLLYVYFDFDVYFFKMFVIHVFLGKFGPKVWSSPTEIWYRHTLLHAYYDFNVYFFKILSFI